MGLLGLSNSGKTTIYNVMTGQEADTGYIHKSGINKSSIEIYDERVKILAEIYQPKKVTYPSVDVFDFAKGDDEENNAMFNNSEIKLLEVVGLVLRCFDDEVINEELGKPDSVKDLYKFESEFILSDLILAEKRLEKLNMNLKRGVRSPAEDAERKLLEKLVEQLHSEVQIKEMALDKEEQRLIKGFQFLSAKPMFIILNTDEANLDSTRKLEQRLLSEGKSALTIVGRYEMELNNLDENDASLFINEIGFDRYAKERIYETAYNALDYIRFYTTGKQEVRSWTLKKESLAPEAAGKIHTDMERGFIRAECFAFTDLIEYGCEKALKEAGKFRLEGKSYTVKDGDILIIRFNK